MYNYQIDNKQKDIFMKLNLDLSLYKDNKIKAKTLMKRYKKYEDFFVTFIENNIEYSKKIKPINIKITNNINLSNDDKKFLNETEQFYNNSYIYYYHIFEIFLLKLSSEEIIEIFGDKLAKKLTNNT